MTMLKETLTLSGALNREHVTAFARTLLLNSDVEVRRIDLTAVTEVDSAGIALLAELVDGIHRRVGERPIVTGQPSGLAELCQAYRIAPDFSDFP